MKPMAAAIILAGIVAVGIVAGRIGEPDLSNALRPPSLVHPVGTDVLGRDLGIRLLLAMSLSLLASASAWALALVFGTMVGIAAGYSEGTFISKLVDELIAIVYATPFFVMLVALLAVLGPSISNSYLVLLLFAWAAPARHAKLVASRLRIATHVRAALALGFRPLQMTQFVLLPQVLPAVAAAALAALPEILALDVALSFFGLGAQPPTPTLGGLIVDGLSYSKVAWWLVAFPLLFLVLVCIAMRSLRPSHDSSNA